MTIILMRRDLEFHQHDFKLGFHPWDHDNRKSLG